MEFILLFLIILINSIAITIRLKNRIEINIPIAIIGIILVVYIFGLFDNLLLGVRIVRILTIFSAGYILYTFIKKRENVKIKNQIITPGLFIYILFGFVVIIFNKNMLFQEYDEFSHWGLIVKHMFEFRKFWGKC